MVEPASACGLSSSDQEVRAGPCLLNKDMLCWEEHYLLLCPQLLKGANNLLGSTILMRCSCRVDLSWSFTPSNLKVVHPHSTTVAWLWHVAKRLILYINVNEPPMRSLAIFCFFSLFRILAFLYSPHCFFAGGWSWTTAATWFETKIAGARMEIPDLESKAIDLNVEVSLTKD